MVAAVLSGRPRQLDRLTHFWSDYAERIDEECRWHICEEYSHFIQVFLTETGGVEGVSSAKQSAAALDILNLFEFSFDIDESN